MHAIKRNAWLTMPFNGSVCARAAGAWMTTM
jgi:hypothetical protein